MRLIPLLAAVVAPTMPVPVQWLFQQGTMVPSVPVEGHLVGRQDSSDAVHGCSVVDEEGTPVDGVKVEMRRGVWGPMWCSVPDGTEAIHFSGTDGGFEIHRPETGTWRLLLTKEGYSPLAVDLSALRKATVLQMHPAVAVTCRVTDSSGTAVPGAHVFARLTAGGASTPRHVSGWATEEWRGKPCDGGSIIIEGLPKGTPVSIWAARGGGVPQPIRTLMPESEPTLMTPIVIAKGVTIRGTARLSSAPGEQVVWIKEATSTKPPFAPLELPIVATTTIGTLGVFSFDGVADGDWVIGYGPIMGEYVFADLNCQLVSIDARKTPNGSVEVCLE